MWPLINSSNLFDVSYKVSHLQYTATPSGTKQKTLRRTLASKWECKCFCVTVICVDQLWIRYCVCASVGVSVQVDMCLCLCEKVHLNGVFQQWTCTILSNFYKRKYKNEINYLWTIYYKNGLFLFFKQSNILQKIVWTKMSKFAFISSIKSF